MLDQNGKLVTVTMGSYGVGVSRAVAAVAEGTCDEKGLCWPRELAPFDVQVLATGKDEAVTTAAADLAVQLDQAGVSVLLDDRKASPGSSSPTPRSWACRPSWWSAAAWPTV